MSFVDESGARMSQGLAADSASSPQATLQEVVQKLSGGYRSVGTMAYDVLRDAILSGVFSPGERLRQEMLAEVIGVSRLPIRSALIQLESEGLVQFHARRGAVVKTLSKAQVEEIYDLRVVLETHALRRAVATITPKRLRQLKALAQEADAQQEGSDFRAARTELYRVLYDADAHPLFWEILESLNVKVGGYLLGLRVSDRHQDSHAELVELIAAGDGNAAVATLSRHLATVRRGVVALVEGGTVAD